MHSHVNIYTTKLFSLYTHVKTVYTVCSLWTNHLPLRKKINFCVKVQYILHTFFLPVVPNQFAITGNHTLPLIAIKGRLSSLYYYYHHNHHLKSS